MKQLKDLSGRPPSEDSLANVLGIEDLVTHFALEAAEVPVFVQGYEGLFVLKLFPAAAAV